jgi:2-polyprenyl-3-methyl-5-hydroxy-6-metoxy-1,4-benzoquinol methylase
MYLDKRNGKKSRVHITKQRRIETTAKLCKGTAMELGCGRGELTNAIRLRGIEVIGVDKNAQKIAEARQLYPHITFHQRDVLKMSLSELAFDTVVLAEILEHVSDAMGSQMLEIAWKLLKPNGRLIVSVPNEHCIPNPNHIRQFSRRSLMAMLQRFGKPRLETDQPYKWLIMHVEKHS